MLSNARGIARIGMEVTVLLGIDVLSEKVTNVHFNYFSKRVTILCAVSGEVVKLGDSMKLEGVSVRTEKVDYS